MLRVMKIIEYALGSMRRRPVQNCALGGVYALIVAILATVQIFSQSMKNEAARLLSDAPELVVQQLLAGRHQLISQSLAADIESIPGVDKVSPRFWGYYYDVLTGANYTLLGRGEIQPADSNLSLLEGRLPEDESECAIGAGVAKMRGLQVGDDLILVDATNLGRSYMICGVFSTSSNLLTNDLVVMTDEELGHFFAMPSGYATDLTVGVRNPREVNTVAAKIKKKYPSSRPITRQEILRTYDAVFDWRSGMLLVVCSSALLAFAILIWNKGSGLSAEERREIGILKAIGWDTSDILLLKFWEAMLLAAAACLTGLLLAYGHMALAGAALLLRPLRGWSVLFPAFQPVITLDLYSIATLLFLAIVPYLAASILPSWKAAVTDPDLVMRY